jgi:hypothetical protein
MQAINPIFYLMHFHKNWAHVCDSHSCSCEARSVHKREPFGGGEADRSSKIMAATPQQMMMVMMKPNSSSKSNNANTLPPQEAGGP